MYCFQIYFQNIGIVFEFKYIQINILKFKKVSSEFIQSETLF
jgi:hypothetical protein